MHTRLAAVAAALLFAVVAAPAQAASVTGQDIFNDPSVTFPTRSPSVSGTSLDFGSGSALGILFRMPLVAPGALSNSDAPTTISFTADMTRLTFDSDAGFFISDGTTMLGVLASDNTGGQLITDTGTDSGTTQTARSLVTFVTGLGFPAVDNSFSYSGEFVLSTTGSTVSGALNAGSISDSFAALDRSAGLDLLFLADDAGEAYRLNTLDLTNSAAPIPEPGTLPLALCGFVGLALVRRRTSRAATRAHARTADTRD
jgi:hypothetical protein